MADTVNTTDTETSTENREAYKKLYRLPKSGKVAGVCAGLAEYLEIDVTLIRVIFVILTLASGGFGIIAYIILAIVVPANDTRVLDSKSANTDIQDNINALTAEIRTSDSVYRIRSMFGLGLILLGIWLLLVQFFPRLISMNWDIVWPAALVLLGLAFLTKSRR